MNKSKIKNQKSKSLSGFTLVEILMAVFLGAVIIMTAWSIYMMSYQSYKKNSANAEVTQNARIALERMSREIRQAQDIVTTIPASQSSATPKIQFQDGHNLMTTPAPSCNIQYITYSLSDGDLHRVVSHFYFTDNPCVYHSDLDPVNNLPPSEQIDKDEIKAQKLSNLQFWGTNQTINLHFTALIMA